jgi:uncharacterized protein
MAQVTSTAMKSKRMNILVAGGTGFIGRALVHELLDAGHYVRVLSRTPAAAEASFRWRVGACTLDKLPLQIDAAVNLTGAPVAKRWTSAHRKAMRESRVEFTSRLREAVKTRGARVFVSASAVGYYGDRGNEELHESSAAGNDFLARMAVDWEAAARDGDMRVVVARMGLVLHPEGGMLGRVLTPFRLGLGGRLGSGRHWMSWVHRADATALLRWALTNPDAQGEFNVTAPEPVTNADFTRTLAAVLRRPALLRVPRAALKLMFGDMSQAILASQRVIPRRALDAGFEFRFPALRPALESLLRAPK